MNKPNHTFQIRKQELHCRIAAPILGYLEGLFGTERMKEIVEPLGLSVAYLKNKNNWMSFSYYNKLLKKIVNVTGDEQAPYKASLRVNLKSHFDFVLFVIYNKIWSGSPKWILRLLLKEDIYRRFSKIGAFKGLSSSANSVVIECLLNKEYKQTQYNCDSIKGMLASIPLAIGLNLAKVTEKQCAAKGARSCIYAIEWKRKINWFVLISLPIIAAIIILQLVIFKNIFGIKDVLFTLVMYLLIFFMHISYNFRKEFVFQETTGEIRNQYLTQTIAKIEKDYNKILKLQYQFHQSQKMEALGRITGGIAHDFNNILTIINGNIECAKLSIKEDKPALENLNEITKAIKRATDLIKQLLTFAKKDKQQPVILDVNDLFADYGKMIKSVVGEGIELAIIPSSHSNNIRIDKNELERVILNIVLNSKDAMDGGGKLTIKTEYISISNVNYKINEPVPGEYLLITISDTGKGIQEQDLPYIFDPFYTTKSESTRTGLGLAICYNIIKKNNGYIFADSKYGTGTNFSIYFPIVKGDIDGISVQEEAKSLPRGSQTILFVEDEEELRKIYTAILKTHGYTIIEAKNGPQALRYLHENPYSKVDLLLTDVIMPEMNGYDLAKKIKSAMPAVKVIFISGYDHDIINSYKINELQSAFLYKPFKYEDLLSTIHSVLTTYSSKA